MYESRLLLQSTVVGPIPVYLPSNRSFFFPRTSSVCHRLTRLNKTLESRLVPKRVDGKSETEMKPAERGIREFRYGSDSATVWTFTSNTLVDSAAADASFQLRVVPKTEKYFFRFFVFFSINGVHLTSFVIKNIKSFRRRIETTIF